MSRSIWSGLRFTTRALGFAVGFSFAAQAAQAQGTAAPAAAPASGTGTSSTAAGRELFDVHCARCHGAQATGTANGPNLLPRVKGMSEQSFVSAVLQRYRFSLPASAGSGESAAREAMLRGLMSRQDNSAGMPAWDGQSAVSQGVKSLYAFLSQQAR